MNLFHITLSTTRKSLYVSVIFTSIALILLPWSILSYLRFYSILIPNASYSLPIEVKRSNLIAANAVELVDNLQREDKALPNLSYDLVLELQVYCPKLLVGDSKLVFGELLWQRESTSNYDKSFLLHCDPRIIYTSFNWLIPYNLRLWVPPFLTNSERLNTISTKIGNFSDREILDNLLTGNRYYHLSILFGLDTPLLVEASKSYLHVNVDWKGIRYYLFYHYYICFVAGVTLFWAVSSGVCLLVSLIVWFFIRGQTKQKSI